jgi:hypothetical protein
LACAIRRFLLNERTRYNGDARADPGPPRFKDQAKRIVAAVEDALATGLQQLIAHAHRLGGVAGDIGGSSVARAPRNPWRAFDHGGNWYGRERSAQQDAFTGGRIPCIVAAQRLWPWH